MKITHEQIKQLVKLHSNDAALGAAIRNLVNSTSNINEVSTDPSQINLIDSINEITKNNGHRY